VPSWLPKYWNGDLTLSDNFPYFQVGGSYPFSRSIPKINSTEVELPGFRVFRVHDLGLQSPDEDKDEITDILMIYMLPGT
jgi:hypothetical protein